MYKVLFNSQIVNEFDYPQESEDFANCIINNQTDIAYNNGSDSVMYEGINGYYSAMINKFTNERHERHENEKR
jgi:hypothetical protein